jgi:radical SAM protein with 4Fe4S-binding SPASM domain
MKVRRFKDLGYSTLFNPATGFFARIEDKGKPEPFWCPHGPELIDISITNWCDKGCESCYQHSSLNGNHISINNFKKVIDSASDMGVYQVALGGGNPNQHPQFIEILKYTYNKGIVPNYTTNGRGLSDAIIKASKEFCGVVAVSAYSPYDETKFAIKKLVEHNIKINIHFILDAISISAAIEWLKSPPDFFYDINALIFLNYKPIGRKIYREKLLKHSCDLQKFFEIATSNKLGFKIGFDACCVSGLFAHTNVNIQTVDACDAGRFSMYISEDLKAYPCSFQRYLVEGDQINEKEDVHKIWLESNNFKSVRDYFVSDKCYGCSTQKDCKNGCPLFDEIILCGYR